MLILKIKMHIRFYSSFGTDFGRSVAVITDNHRNKLRNHYYLYPLLALMTLEAVAVSGKVERS